MLLEFKYNVGWTEWFAQALAIQAQPDISGISNRPMLDLTVTDGYFFCTAGTGRTSYDGTALPKGWLYYVYRQLTVTLPTTPVNCTAAMPGWPEYQPLQ
jgi:hypothetical protein